MGNSFYDLDERGAAVPLGMKTERKEDRRHKRLSAPHRGVYHFLAIIRHGACCLSMGQKEVRPLSCFRLRRRSAKSREGEGDIFNINVQDGRSGFRPTGILTNARHEIPFFRSITKYNQFEWYVLQGPSAFYGMR